MEPDKILEIARRYMTSDTTDNFACTKEHLIAFVEAVTEAERERIKQIVRDVTEGRSNCNLLLERIVGK